MHSPGETKNVKGGSSLVSVILVILLLAGLSYFFSYQLRSLSYGLNSIENGLKELIDQGHQWIENTFGIGQPMQTQYLKDPLSNFLRNSTSAITQTIYATADFFISFFLFLTSLFFFLYNRRFLLSFLYQWYRPEDHGNVKRTITHVEWVVRNYTLGLGTVILIAGLLNSIGLTLLGIEHAIFFGVLAAVLMIVPYVGILLGSLLPILYAFFTTDSVWYPIGVAIVLLGVRFLKSNYIIPRMVGGLPTINPFAMIIALFFSGMIWGILGLILAIPVLAAIKVICDSVEPGGAFSFLLGQPAQEKTLAKIKP